MRIAIASGKGGTGKTTVATSLALCLAADRAQPNPVPDPLLFLDCDVEAPNAHLFLRPTFERRVEVGLLIPLGKQGNNIELRKAAQRSVHLTVGTRRVFQAFFWLQWNPVFKASLYSASPQLTHADGRRGQP
jgi:hypothetical protein